MPHLGGKTLTRVMAGGTGCGFFLPARVNVGEFRWFECLAVGLERGAVNAGCCFQDWPAERWREGHSAIFAACRNCSATLAGQYRARCRPLRPTSRWLCTECHFRQSACCTVCPRASVGWGFPALFPRLASTGFNFAVHLAPLRAARKYGSKLLQREQAEQPRQR